MGPLENLKTRSPGRSRDEYSPSPTPRARNSVGVRIFLQDGSKARQCAVFVMGGMVRGRAGGVKQALRGKQRGPCCVSSGKRV